VATRLKFSENPNRGCADWHIDDVSVATNGEAIKDDGSELKASATCRTNSNRRGNVWQCSYSFSVSGTVAGSAKGGLEFKPAGAQDTEYTSVGFSTDLEKTFLAKDHRVEFGAVVRSTSGPNARSEKAITVEFKHSGPFNDIDLLQLVSSMAPAPTGANAALANALIPELHRHPVDRTQVLVALA
jgi:hypothetical protein